MPNYIVFSRVTVDLILQYKKNGTIDEKIIILDANSVVKIHSTGIPDNVNLAILQAHTQIHVLTLARQNNLEYGNHVNGSSIGIYSEVQDRGASGYLFNNNPFNVTALVFFVFYDRSGKKSYICLLCMFILLSHGSSYSWWLQFGV